MTKHERALTESLGFDPDGPVCQGIVSEELAPEYPLAVYSIAGWTLVMLCEELSDVMDDILAVAAGRTAEEILRDVFPDLECEPDGSEIFTLGEDRQPQDAPAVMLTGADTAALEALMDTLTDRERLTAEVRPDDPVIAGVFEDGRLISAGSCLDWNEEILDITVATDPAYREQGAAKRVVRTLTEKGVSEGRIMQYRCGAEDRASQALARKCGYVLMAEQTGAVVFAED